MSRDKSSQEFLKRTAESKQIVAAYSKKIRNRRDTKTGYSQGPNKLYRTLAVVGGLTIFGAAGAEGWSYIKEHVLTSSEARDVAARLCSSRPAVAEMIADEACSKKVTSQFPLKPKNPDADGIKGSIEYVLSGHTSVAPLTEGNGIGLYVPIAAHVTDKYADTLKSISDPTGSQFNVLNFFKSMYPVVKAGGEPAALAQQSCYDDVDLLMTTVRENPDTFAAEGFPTSYIANAAVAHNRQDYAPYSAVPLPSDTRYEIVFMSDKKELRCPPPGP